MFLLFFSENQFKKSEYDECKGPNTYKDVNGTCTCLKNFPFGDPYSQQGCYVCNDQCHDNAKCIFPGKCECVDGLIGDGKSHCDLPIPKLLSVSPSKVSKINPTIITAEYEISSNFTAIAGYCRIGTLISKAEKVSRREFKCKVIPSETPIQRVSISFDNISWTEEALYIQFIENYAPETFQIVWQVWIFVIIIVGGVYLYFRTKKVEEKAEQFTKEEKKKFLEI
ncbi:hypothetical protein TVAG_366050 [Trichomonas vaginalis G3]|uniref:Uncharacterized protein n=1 Tax=Trichomonas vaginalis (strain ATCC PRA-98 / G3) TaxID=412133 RepID=A2DHP9_TRIV3|nr:hypothetical protein TVAGG3_0303100 [Trichomonas vaginalis G3]EAY20097.1 hypothetical protein TVAG_366050 [Trichomonas vaginalis G3]KAI5528050.1 hypothetical protein TVAGG3_0303100 [Trichomonas vaginalis G3]|eukprot:XP_001581083.1 hypothetical protein [Trichomonas vaginalis G3]